MNMDALAAGMQTKLDDKGRKVIDFSLGTSLASELGAANAVIAILAAVLSARQTGEGASIDISCWDAAVEIHRLGLARQGARGVEESSAADGAVLYTIYQGGDGADLVFCPIERRFWVRFCEGVGRPDLIERWKAEPGVGADYRTGDEELRAELTSIFQTDTAAAWHDRFVEWGVPGCKMIGPEELYTTKNFADRHLAERGDGPMPVILDPIRWMDGSRPGEGAVPPPGLGQHRDEAVQRWLGKTKGTALRGRRSRCVALRPSRGSMGTSRCRTIRFTIAPANYMLRHVLRRALELWCRKDRSTLACQIKVPNWL